MKIGILCNYQLKETRVGGIDVFFKNFNNRLLEEKINVDWYFSGIEGIVPEFYSKFNIRSLITEEFLTVVKSDIEKSERIYDLLIFHFYPPVHSELKYFHSFTKEIVCVDHNSRPKGFYFTKRHLKNLIKGIFYFNYVDKIICVSNYSRRKTIMEFGPWYNSKTTVIYNGVELHKQIKLNVKSNRLICFSNLVANKGVDLLIHAVSELVNESYFNFTLDIYGDGPEYLKLDKMITDFDLRNTVKLYPSSNSITEILPNYDYFVFPSFQENFSFSILESLSLNVPVITTRVGGNVEVIEHLKNGILFSPGNLNELKNALKFVSENDKLLKRDVTNTVKRFSIESMVDEHIRLLYK